MQNKNTQKKISSKLLVLFVVMVSLAFGLSDAFGGYGPQPLPAATDLTISLLAKDKEDVTKRTAAINKVPGLEKAKSDDFNCQWNNDATQLTLTSLENKQYASGSISLKRTDPTTQDESDKKSFYKKWPFWAIIGVSVVAIGGGVFYYVKNKQQN